MVEPLVEQKPIAAIGNFDGVHLGHQYLLRETIKLAAQENVPAGVVVFDPHPQRFFRPNDPAFLLTTSMQRDALLLDYGADFVLPLNFDAEMAGLTPEAFVRRILHEELNLGGVVTGSEFQFGKGRVGNVETLKSLCAEAGIQAYQIAPLSKHVDSDKIGSSAVRQALRDGDVKCAEQLMGHPWSVSAVVEKGRELGRTIGFPTANLRLGELVEPKYGVYAVTVLVDRHEPYNGVANFGCRPTVGSDVPLLEVHLLNFDGDIYGETIEVAFVDFIRPEQKFDGLEALQKQIAIDCKTAEKILIA